MPKTDFSELPVALEELDRSPVSPIRVSRNGSVTRFLDEDVDMVPSAVPESVDEASMGRLRPMPKRLSEEVREEADRQARVAADSIPVTPQPKPRAKRIKKSAAENTEDQIALPLKAPKAKADSMVRQRQVLGFVCIIAALLILIAIVTYSASDASVAETKISDLPSLFLPHGDAPDPVRDAVRANADQVKNGFGLIGAILANFFINRTIGYAAILYPIFFGAWSLAFFRFSYKQRKRLTLATSFFLVTGILFSATMGTASLFFSLPREWSGSVGQFLGIAFSRAIGSAGAFIIYAAAFVVMLIFSIDLDIEKTFHRLRSWWQAAVLWSRRQAIEFWEKRQARLAEKEERRKAELLEEEQVQAEEAATATAVTEEVSMLKTSSLKNVACDEEPSQEEKIPVPQPIVKKIARADKNIALSGSSTTASAAPSIAAEPKAASIVEPVTPVATERVIPAAIAADSAVVVPRTENNPLLKVRPVKKGEGGAIPRITRNGFERLGGNSRHFSRLSNGAIDEEETRIETPAPAETPVSAVKEMAPTSEPIVADLEAATIIESALPLEAIPSVARELGIENIDTTEEIIEPLKRKAKEEAVSAVPVMLGDEKVLSNEALPHSVSDDSGLPIPRLSNSKPVSPIVEGEDESEDLFFEEGERPVVPENPYIEILSKYRNPSLELLTPADPKDALDANDEELAKKGRLLRDKLATFGVDIENITVTPGPVVTLYEFTPAEGIKVSRVENLTDDIALAMKARGIRIIAPIPGRGTIGVEIPNDVAKMVRIRSLFSSESFRNTKMNLPLALGMTISGDVYVDDLNKMPHLLIAGATGSGKSVGVNGIIASLLYAKSPRDVKFVIIDPKKIELSLYKKLRKHYLIVSPDAAEDIVTTPVFAVAALKAVEIEMERRYDKLAKAAVRSLADYNIKVAQGKLRSTQDEQHYHLPYIVVIIDELADLMITASREIEEPICRIAQMARAVGIHMILATQRPSVDVITGVIKANFPARMAYQVATRVDSRTILDIMGAEQLLGNGDMLYQPSGTPKPIRLQSPFISTEEVEAIVDAVAEQEGDKLSYSRPWALPALTPPDEEDPIDIGDERDENFEEAAKVVVRHQQGSVSLLQRRLKIGYSRAARVMDELEAAGIVGPFDGSKARQVLCENEAELEVVLEGLRKL